MAGLALAFSGLAWAAAPTLGTAEVGVQAATPFEYTGEMQTYTVPEGVCEVTVDVSGAQGGDGYYTGFAGLSINANATPSSGSPGLGGRVQGTLTVTPGETLHVFVGGAGGDGDVVVGPPDGAAQATGGAGGWNGGGAGGGAAIDDEIQPDDTYYAGVASAGGGGGGASDIRRGGTAESNRVVVAGGGGGSGANGISASTPADSLNQRDGGSGGDANGGDGSDGEAAPGTGGDGGAQAGATGSPGGFATSQNDDDFLLVVASAGGGGGGGYAGGDGGQAANNANGVLSGGAGGGGAGSAFGPFGATITDAFQDGNGYVEITPAAPGVGCAPVLQVAKVVSGTAPAGFTVRVECEAAVPAEVQPAATDTVVLTDLPYLADGSPDPANAPAGWTIADGAWELDDADLGGATCTATETDTAGAASVSYACAWSSSLADVPADSGCPGGSSGPSALPQSVFLSDSGQTGVLTVTNVFPVAAAEVSPNFTG